MQKQHFVRNKITGERYRLDDANDSCAPPENEKLRQKFSDFKQLRPEQLPPRVDLREKMTPVEKQNPLSTCLSCSFAGAFEYLLKSQSGQHIDISRLFIYYNARKKALKPGQKLRDGGSNIAFTIETLHEVGVCREPLWKYDVKKVHDRPSDEAYEAAKGTKITSALEVNQDLIEMKTCLAQGYPFVFSVRLFQSFVGTGKDGVVRMPKPTDKQATRDNRHAMLAVGYSDKTKEFIVRNSWGDTWGQNGYCFMPYDYLTDPTLCFYRWVVRAMDTDMIEGDYRIADDSTFLHAEDEEDDFAACFEFDSEEEQCADEQVEPQQGELGQELQEEFEQRHQDELGQEQHEEPEQEKEQEQPSQEQQEEPQQEQEELGQEQHEEPEPEQGEPSQEQHEEPEQEQQEEQGQEQQEDQDNQ